MKIDIPISRLELIDEALATQIRLLDSYVNKAPEQQSRLARFRSVKYDIETLLLRGDDND